MIDLRIAFIWPWVEPILRYMLNMGPGMVPGVGTGIAPPGPPQPCTTPGTPLPHRTEPATPRTLDHVHKLVVGLKSVGQLTLGTHFSGFQGITEGYNLVIVGRINNHFHIPGFD